MLMDVDDNSESSTTNYILFVHFVHIHLCCRVSNTSHGYPVHSGTNTHMLPAIPEMASAYPHATYQQYPNYAAGQHATSLRPDVPPQWNGPPMMTHVEPLEPYVSGPLLCSLCFIYLK